MAQIISLADVRECKSPEPTELERSLQVIEEIRKIGWRDSSPEGAEIASAFLHGYGVALSATEKRFIQAILQAVPEERLTILSIYETAKQDSPAAALSPKPHKG